MPTNTKTQTPTPQQRAAVIKKAMKAPQKERMAVLKRAGIVNSNGELTKHYRPPSKKKS